MFPPAAAFKGTKFLRVSICACSSSDASVSVLNSLILSTRSLFILISILGISTLNVFSRAKKAGF